jgi:hypothetical protein
LSVRPVRAGQERCFKRTEVRHMPDLCALSVSSRFGADVEGLGWIE